MPPPTWGLGERGAKTAAKLSAEDKAIDREALGMYDVSASMRWWLGLSFLLRLPQVLTETVS